MWRETTKHGRNMKIWREEFESFIPQKVLDFHVHVFNEKSVPEDEFLNCGGTALTRYDFDDLRQDLEDIYPERQSEAVCFGLPFPVYDQQENNRYIAEGCDRKKFFGLRLLNPSEDPDTVRRDVEKQKFLGFKPYPDYVGKDDVSTVEINEMLPAGLMEVANDLGLLIMLHIPRKLRLADPTNQKQIVELCKDWPKAKIVLAHVGRAYYLKNVVGYLEGLKGLPNLYFDLAMLNNWEVLEHLFQSVDPGKILFGTDTPIALAAGKSVEINDQYTYVTPADWPLSITDNRKKLIYTSFLYEELRAIKKAADRSGLRRAFIEGVFYHNGKQLLDSIGQDRK
jgi:predicted TIM-barrel fold metal-dependent hydrolase